MDMVFQTVSIAFFVGTAVVRFDYINIKSMVN